MGMDEMTSWVIIRRYDILDYDQTSSCSPVGINLRYDSNFTEIKVELKKFLGIKDETNKVIKLRQKDGTLVSLMCLLEGNSKDSPFWLDVAWVHQNTTACTRQPMTSGYIQTVKSKVKSLCKRVEHVENVVPELQSRKQASVEEIIQQLSTKVNFLDKRLEELAPLEWKMQFQQPVQ